VFTAKPAILVQFELVRGVFLVFCRVVVSLLAFIASKCDFYSHCGSSLWIMDVNPDCLPEKLTVDEVFDTFSREKLTRLSTGKRIIAQRSSKGQQFF